jgi:hypothetical protein
MATGRTLQRFARIYAGGYDLSGYSRSLGPLTWEFEAPELVSWVDPVVGVLNGMPTIGIGTLNGLFDNTATSGLHVLTNTPASRTVLYAQGIRADPAIGDPTFAGVFIQKNYHEVDSSGAATVTIDFDKWDASALPTLQNIKPWGVLLHANSAETAVNAAVAPAVLDNGAATTNGAWCMWQVLGGNGTATFKVQDSATNADNASFADVTGLTSGSISASTPSAGVAYTAAGATIRRYVRWQIVLGSATIVTFALALMRA